MIKVLIIEDDELLARTIELEIQDMGHQTRIETTFAEGRDRIKTWRPDLVMLDVHLPDRHNLTSLPSLLADSPDSIITVMTGDPDNNVVIDAMKEGAFDFLRKPFDLEDIYSLITKAVRQTSGKRRSINQGKDGNNGNNSTNREIIGISPAIISLLKDIGMLSRTRVTVLIEGDSGSGKELVARTLHHKSCPTEPFVAINCSAIVPTLLESELFGHEKGAFTGAERTKVGKLQFAEKGTVFLDEIGDMPLELQGKLLRVLQEEEFNRVGGLENIPLQARIIAATNQKLELLIQAKKFREDLYYRLAVTRLTIPPLRDRREDIPLLVNHCLHQISQRLNTSPVTIDATALKCLQNHRWAGNIRELENMLTRAIALSSNAVLTIDELDFMEPHNTPYGPVCLQAMPLEEAETRHIESSLRANKWHITNTAKELGISQTTLRKKISAQNLRPGRRHKDPKS